MEFFNVPLYTDFSLMLRLWLDYNYSYCTS